MQAGSRESLVSFSHSDNVTRYRVSIGNVENMPNCTCSLLKRLYYPCNHVFVVFRKFLNWSWDLLSPLYVNFRYLQLESYSKEKQCSTAKNSLPEPQNAENMEKSEN